MFRERKINISLDFIVLISEMRDYSFRCLFKWPIPTDMMSSGHVEKHHVRTENMTLVSSNLRRQIHYVTTVGGGRHHKTGKGTNKKKNERKTEASKLIFSLPF